MLKFWIDKDDQGKFPPLRGIGGRDRNIQANHDVEGLKIDIMHRVLREE